MIESKMAKHDLVLCSQVSIHYLGNHNGYHGLELSFFSCIPHTLLSHSTCLENISPGNVQVFLAMMVDHCLQE